jgi:hypothetical protein
VFDERPEQVQGLCSALVINAGPCTDFASAFIGPKSAGFGYPLLSP